MRGLRASKRLVFFFDLDAEPLVDAGVPALRSAAPVRVACRPASRGLMAEAAYRLCKLAIGGGLAEARGDDGIGASTLFGVGHLAREDLLEFLGRHAGSAQHTLRLQEGRRADDDGLVDPPAARLI